jgi:hypothetical protein
LGEQKGILYRLETLDRRVLFWIGIIVIVAVLLNPIPIPMPIGKYSQMYYDEIAALQPGDVVVFGQDFEIADWTEMRPAMITTARHLAWGTPKGVKVIMWTTESPTAAMLRRQELIPIFEDARSNKEYGVDYVDFGFISGGEVSVVRLARDIPGLLTSDWYGTPISDLPIMEGVEKAEDVDLLIVSGTGNYMYLRQDWTVTFHVRCLQCSTSGGIAGVISNIDVLGLSHGMVGGPKMSAEYEVLTGYIGRAVGLTSAVAFYILLYIGFIGVCNVIYFARKFAGGAA